MRNLKKLKKKKRKNICLEHQSYTDIEKEHSQVLQKLSKEDIEEMKKIADGIEISRKQGAIFGFRCDIFDDLMKD